MATPNYAIDPKDERLTSVKDEESAKQTELDNTYGSMVDNADSYYQAQIDAAKDYAETQKENQQAQTDFAIQEINQQKGQAQKDYIKEQSGAYTDWQKQSNKYGANAEQMAASGLQNSGFSESSQVSMYNQYQNRVATAREAYSRAVLAYDNAITQARLQNNSALAEIAYNALQKQLELSLAGFQYKNTLVLEKLTKKNELSQMYHSRYQDVLKQINTENALAENVRQYEATLAENKRQHDESLAFQKEQFAWQKEQANKSVKISGGNGGGSRTSKKAKQVDKLIKDQHEKVVNRENKGKDERTYDEAIAYLNDLIKSGANEDRVANEISLALREGALTTAQAKTLRARYTPKGVRYN